MKRKPRLKRTHPDYVLLACTLVLLVFGVVMIYSSSNYNQLQFSSDRHKLLYDTLRWDAIGLAVLFVSTIIPYYWYKKWKHLFVWIFYAIVVTLLIVIMFQPASRGVHRWFNVGNYQFQPSELMKLAIILVLAAYLESVTPWGRKIGPMIVNFLILIVLVIGLPVFLIYIEPNKSTAFVVTAIGFTMLFLDGANIFLLGASASAAIGIVYAKIKSSNDYALERLVVHSDKTNVMDEAWQIRQSLIAFGLGGIRGVGIGNGIQNKMYLPEVSNDFILGNIAEELGLIGTASLLLLYLVVLYRCIKIAMGAPDRFSSLVVSGITVMLSIHIFLNYGVTTDLLPTTGITLPLVSYGGTSTVVFMACIGLVLGISMFQKVEVVE